MPSREPGRARPAHRYVIITPARNEAKLIGETIRSVIAQTVKPVRWIIVNDGSTDGTADIVESRRKGHPFIELVNAERTGGRHFGNKVRAFNRGLERIGQARYDFIGNLDADISVEPDYFEKLLARFQGDPALGLAGGMVASCSNGSFLRQNVAPDSVAGAVQLFRRKCFEEINGYVPLPQGGIDAAAEIMARMKGWRVRTFPELTALEHRWTGSADTSPLRSRLREGRRLYSLGYSPLFFLARCVYRAFYKPAFIGSAAALIGYLAAWGRREPLSLPGEVVAYLRAEQRAKLAGNAKLPALRRIITLSRQRTN